jgi:hypothetical protein
VLLRRSPCPVLIVPPRRAYYARRKRGESIRSPRGGPRSDGGRNAVNEERPALAMVRR